MKLSRFRWAGPALGAGAVLLSVALTVGPAAATAGPAVSAAKPAGYQLIKSGPVTAAPMAQTDASLTCPGSKLPSDASIATIGDKVDDSINSSWPSGQSWDVIFNNESQSAETFVLSVICLAPPSSYAVVTAAGSAVTGFQTDASAICPTDTVVSGGGATSGSSSIAVGFNSSFPAPYGWRVDLNDLSGSNFPFTVYAVCLAEPADYALINSRLINNPKGAHTKASEPCPESPATVAIGGGVISETASAEVETNSSSLEGKTGWTAVEQNGYTAGTQLEVFAVCAA